MHVRTRRTTHGARTFQFDYERLVKGLPEPLTDRQQDFADVLGVLFALDVACHRGVDADWTRTIEAWVPVRDPDLWNSLAGMLGRCFGAFTYDRLDLHFVPDAQPAPAIRPRGREHPASSGVALLSGGVDSFVGAAKLLTDGGRPLLLSHKNSSAAGAALNAIMPSLTERGAPAEPLSFTARRMGGGEGEGSQRARSMVYMGLAALLACASGHDEIWINENGVMAVHLPLTEARTGSFSTRTASPRAIAQFARFVEAALGRRITVSNLLVTMTKPEVAELGVALGVGDVLPQTVSCWSVGRTSSHCGRCVPCLIRQISHEWASVPANPYDTLPMDALPTEPAAAAVARDNVSQMLQLATDLLDRPDELLQLDYPELLDVAAPLTVASSLAMHRRWAEQIIDVAQRHAYTRGQL